MFRDQHPEKMKTILHRAATRGYANHGWLDTHHTFSFANYHHPERMHFGVLRVLNDDVIAGGSGFGTHPHNNMEIISIPLSGALEHKDSMGHTRQLHTGEVQVMSAGSGVTHSEYNASREEAANFLQLWIFPKSHNITPQYNQKVFPSAERVNHLQLIAAPTTEDGALTIHQDAWLYLADPEKNHALSYTFRKPGNGLYIFVIEGTVEVAGETLDKRDGIGLWDTGTVSITATQDAKLLLIEVPMEL